jgi:hypothetical protein
LIAQQEWDFSSSSLIAQQEWDFSSSSWTSQHGMGFLVLTSENSIGKMGFIILILETLSWNCPSRSHTAHPLHIGPNKY